MCCGTNTNSTASPKCKCTGKGETGDPGFRGSFGSPGPHGETGPRGNPGYRGKKGDHGDVGPIGLRGEKVGLQISELAAQICKFLIKIWHSNQKRVRLVTQVRADPAELM